MLDGPVSLPRWLIPALVLSAILASLSIGYRFRVESRNKAATLAIEIETAEAVSIAQGFDLDESLRRLKAKGVGALVLSEETVADLINVHRVEFSSGPALSGEEETLARVLQAMRRRYPRLAVAAVAGKIDLSGPSMPSEYAIRTLSVGLNPDEAARARRAGLRVVARFANPLGVTDAYVRETLRLAVSQGADVFLPQGDQVLGRRGSILALEAALQEFGVLYASPEFTKIGGDANVVADIPGSVVRLHSALAAELDKLPIAEAVDRYARAARERNQRILLLRPVSFGSETPLDDLEDFVDRVAKAARRQGGEIGVAKPFEEPGVPQALFVLIGLSIAPVLAWTGALFLPARWSGTVWGLSLAAGLSCAFPAARPGMAFLAAVALPILAFIVLEARAGTKWPLEYLVVSLISLVGGLCVAGLLNGLPYLIRAEQFEGVKVAVFLPIAAVGAFFFARFSNLGGALRGPVTWGQAALALGLLGLLAFMISRTGNDNPAGVSGLELRARSILDALLFVRPRTKEFLIGHPLLVIGICMLIRSRSGRMVETYGGWTALALMAGAVGQTDLVNTMCHLHTPVTLSLVRIAVGWVAGGILGSVLWLAVSRWGQAPNDLGSS
ncbi:MAG: hypothetical protein HYR64_09965 [Fimbriimonas ginsengisoli]|uniref:Uncharacterized protein n=1 Tax=Fimbriimonas ginsengisoli TaxID=1005039 RepID=A0A931LTY5_FIMGI|nr:hypothetical protein [Fimbriimonas ginsengisoli]